VARIEYYFRETASGIRRNGTIAFGAVMTAFIALFLFGLALLIRREISLVIESITGNVQVQVYVEDNASQETIDQIHTILTQLPAVASADYENKAEACARAQAIFSGNPTIIENTTCDIWPTSFRVTLADTSQYAQIPAALGCEADSTGALKCSQPGVTQVHDWRDVLDRLSAITTAVSLGLFGLSVTSVSARQRGGAGGEHPADGMFARRKEISIMRLVGATNWRIRVPFLHRGRPEALWALAWP
jgi:cell division transport system permease protein